MPDTDEITTVIESADLDSTLDTSQGDCVSIAQAIYERFGGTPIIFYRTPEKNDVMHAIVEIDNFCFDGDGQVSFEYLLKIACLDAEELQPERGYTEYTDSDLFVYGTDFTKSSIYNESKKEVALEKLRS